jgi:ADP-ribosylglycohydrolase
MSHITIQERAAGALLGAFIGDALGLGPHWYYNLDELRRDYGDWISDYSDPQPGRYHAGLKAWAAWRFFSRAVVTSDDGVT